MQIIKIDEDKCTGCGACVSNCAQSALKIIDGKARLVGESLCDGMGICIGSCPQGAITFQDKEEKTPAGGFVAPERSQGGCPGTVAQDFRNTRPVAEEAAGVVGSRLRQWPVQLALVNPRASYFKGAQLLIAADCTAFAFGEFHRRFLEGKALITFCPKLDGDKIEVYRKKLLEIFSDNDIKSATVLKMEVPCCTGTLKLVEDAIRASGKNTILKEYTLTLQGALA
jgi:NAD-dependent dihydropyrimidine dehydrogenase PreA subunit